MIKTFYSDLDDFAFLTTPHYERAKALAIFFMVKEFDQKFPALEKVMEKLESIDTSEHEMGYHILERFPISLVKTYQEVAKSIGIKPRKDVEEEIFEIGMGPFNINIYKGQDLMPGYQRLMDYLKEHNIKLGIITKGQKEYQTKKINHFDLLRWFDLDNIHILENKTQDNLASLVEDPESTMFGTDSLYDVDAALKAGIKVLHIPLPRIYTTSFNNKPISTLSKNYNRFDSIADHFDLITTLFE